MHVYDILWFCARAISLRNRFMAALALCAFLCIACGGGSTAGAGATAGSGGSGGGGSASSGTSMTTGSVGYGGGQGGGQGGGGDPPATCTSDKDCPTDLPGQPICTVVACDPTGSMAFPNSKFPGCYLQPAALFTECFNGCPGFCMGDGPGGGGMPPWMCEPVQPCPDAGP